MEKKINITFVLPSLIPGGAERILSFVALHLDRSKFNATLLVVGYEKDTVYDTKDLHVIYLNKPRVLKSFFSLFHYFKKNKPDIVVSSIVHLNTLIAFMSPFFRRTKFVSREANVLSVLAKHNPYTKSIFPKWMVTTGYKLVDKIICQSKDMQNDMTTNYGVKKEKTTLINNPITNTFQTKPIARDFTKPIHFITIGRLSKEKGHDRILEALSQVDFPFKYTIIGNGVEKETIFNDIENKGLTSKVNYVPFTKHVETYLAESDLFLQGSYVEGFPNVLIESCVVGTPILAFNAPGGLDEIIENGKNGYIANTLDAYIEKLNALNTDFTFTPETVSDIVKSRFNKSKIITEYELLFKSLTHKKP